MTGRAKARHMTEAPNIHRRRAVKSALKDVYRLLITEDRWVQGYWHIKPNGDESNYTPEDERYWEESCPADGACCFCLDGAIGIVSANEQVYRDTVQHLDNVLQRHQISESSVIGYNDDGDTTKEDVANVLKLAIKEVK